MDVLFLSERIFIDDDFVPGGIVVTPEGTIRTIIRGQAELNSWMYAFETQTVSVAEGAIQSRRCVTPVGHAGNRFDGSKVTLVFFRPTILENMC